MDKQVDISRFTVFQQKDMNKNNTVRAFVSVLIVFSLTHTVRVHCDCGFFCLLVDFLFVCYVLGCFKGWWF